MDTNRGLTHDSSVDRTIMTLIVSIVVAGFVILTVAGMGSVEQSAHDAIRGRGAGTTLGPPSDIGE